MLTESVQTDATLRFRVMVWVVEAEVEREDKTRPERARTEIDAPAIIFVVWCFGIIDCLSLNRKAAPLLRFVFPILYLCLL